MIRSKSVLGFVAVNLLMGASACGPRPADGEKGSGGGIAHGSSDTGGGADETSGGSCSPGETESCYDGPEGTLGVALCAAGKRTCADDGTWDACEGQTLPQPENCATPDDEDCNGYTCGEHVFSATYGDSGWQEATGVASDASGNVYLAGRFAGTIDLGGGPLTSAGGDDVYVTKLDPNGNHLWSKRYGWTGTDRPLAIAADDSGVVVGGQYVGTIGFGGEDFTAIGIDMFVAKLDTDGHHVWSMSMGSTGAQTVTALAIDASGDVVMAADNGGVLGCFTETCPISQAQDLFVGKLDGTNGELVWGTALGGAGAVHTASIDVDPSGNVGLGGHFSGTSEMGPKTLVAKGSYDGFVVTLSPTGNVAHVSQIGATGQASITSVRFGQGGGLVVAGAFAGQLDLPGASVGYAGQNQAAFVAALDASGGATWAQAIEASWSASEAQLVVDAEGNVVVAGTYQGTMTLGGEAMSSDGLDAFLVKLAPSGKALWARGLTGSGSQIPAALTLSAGNRVIAAGRTDGPVDFGGGTLSVKGSSDAFVAAFAP